MNTLKGPLWWDRELDPTGKPIRLDVRSAACEVWNDACNQTRTLLGDACEAAALMERSVVQISRYLNRRGLPMFSQDTNGLLMCAFCRALRRHVAKLRRIELADNISEISASRASQSCTSKRDCELDAKRGASHLGERGRQMYEWRKCGFEWKEIAQMLGTSDSAARAEFSRELRKARLKVHNRRSSGLEERDSN